MVSGKCKINQPKFQTLENIFETKQLILPALPSKSISGEMKGQKANESFVFTLLRRSRLKTNLDLDIILLCKIFNF